MTDKHKIKEIGLDVWLAGHSKGGQKLPLYSVMKGDEKLEEFESEREAESWAEGYVEELRRGDN